MISDLDSIFAAATTPADSSGIATLQRPAGSAPVRRAKPPVSSGGPSVGGGSEIWQQLMDEYGKVDASFSTADFDKAAEAEYGNISTRADQSANAAAADYTNRARQAGGSAEGAGLIKAEALVSGRREVADARLKQLQYDIEQREKARNLAADIASKIGGLREGYLENLTKYQIAQLETSTQKEVADKESGWHYAAINAGLQEASWAHPQLNPAYQNWQNQSSTWGWMHPWGGLNPYTSNAPSRTIYPSFTPYGG